MVLQDCFYVVSVFLVIRQVVAIKTSVYSALLFKNLCRFLINRSKYLNTYFIDVVDVKLLLIFEVPDYIDNS